MKPFCVEVRGDFACFTRPEFKAERLSYPVITPSAARAVFDAILWKPGLRWRVERIEILNPVRWISVRRNEVGAVASTRNAEMAMNAGRGRLALYIEEERQQRAGRLLRAVAYRLYATLDLLSPEARANPSKYIAMFNRRAQAGQCVNQPYLGCREFAARFRPVALEADEQGRWRPGEGEAQPLEGFTEDLGWMLFDHDYPAKGKPQPRFFHAHVRQGVIDLAEAEVRQ